MTISRSNGTSTAEHVSPRAIVADAEACVEAILAYHGQERPIRRMRGGDPVISLSEALHEAGFNVSEFTASLTALQALELPCILPLEDHQGRSRLVVCYGFESGQYVIGDAPGVIHQYAPPDLARCWTSRTLLYVSVPCRSSSERYLYLDVALTPFGRDRALIRSNQTGVTKLTTAVEAERLLLADVFLTREALEAKIAGCGPYLPAGMTPARLIESWIEQGLLTAETALRNEVARRAGAAGRDVSGSVSGDQRGVLSGDRSDRRGDLDRGATDAQPGGRQWSDRMPSSATRPRQQISSIGIPTRDRPESLLAALHSYMSNAQTHGRSPRFMVADGSCMQVQMGLKLALESLGTGFATHIEHLDDAWKSRIITEVRAEMNCSPALLRFALFGSDRCASNHGANRNALLMATAGELTLQVDDDTRLPVSKMPGSGDGKIPGSGDRLAVTSQMDPCEYWFDELDAEPVRSEETDFTGLHEDLLGRSVAAVLGEYSPDALVVDGLKPELLDVLKRHDARVALTLVGHRGDAGTSSNVARLFLHGESLRRLIRPGYAERIRTREVVRTVPCRTISGSPFCVAMNLGMDNRDVLPPFMPVGRNEDGVFGAVLAASAPEKLRGYREGYVILHQPAEHREPFDDSIRFDGFRTNDLMIGLIQGFAASRPPALQQGLESLGTQLRECASLEQPEFDRLCRARVHQVLGLIMFQVERALSNSSLPAAPLRADISAYKQSLESFVTRDDCDVPTDLEGSPVERRAHFRELVHAYGDLLTNWPEIVHIARHARLERNGHA